MSADATGGREPHLPKRGGCKGCPGSTHLFTVPLEGLLDEFVYHLRQVLRRGHTSGAQA